MTALPPPARALTVAQLIPALESGGVERGAIEVSRALVERGHRSLVVSAGGRLARELNDHGARHVRLDLGRKSPRTLRQIPRLRDWAREEAVDILHPRSRLPAWIAYRAWRRMPTATRPRLVTSVHGLHGVSCYSRIVTAGERVEVVSEAARQYVLSNYPRADPGKLVLIPRGVDPAECPHGHRPTDRWIQEWRLRYPHLRDKFVVVLAGRLTRLKGQRDLLKLLDRLAGDDLPLHGLIVGEVDPKRTAYAAELHRVVKQRKLTGRVTFTGHRSDLRDILASSQAALSLSTKPESFGRAVLESVALGVPTFGYDHGGVGEVLGRVYPQGRIPLGDLDALADALHALARGEIAAPAPDPTLGGFTLRAMLDRTLAMYEGLAG